MAARQSGKIESKIISTSHYTLLPPTQQNAYILSYKVPKFIWEFIWNKFI